MAALGTRKLRFFVGAVEFTDSVADVRVLSGKRDTDFMTFAEAASGGAREYKLKLVMSQDTAAASLWYYIWGSAGTDVATTIWPNGGTVASATTPKITGTVTITEPDGDMIGGEANESNTAKFKTEVEWTYTAKPALVIV